MAEPSPFDKLVQQNLESKLGNLIVLLTVAELKVAALEAALAEANANAVKDTHADNDPQP